MKMFYVCFIASSLVVLVSAFDRDLRGVETVIPGDSQIVAILREHCFQCHGEKVQKGDLRLDQLSRDFVSGGDTDMWHEVLDRVAIGEMPPKTAKPLPTEQRQALTAWLRNGLTSAAQAKRSGGGSVTLRRLTKDEYQQTMEDLLGFPIDVSKLPPDPPSKDGFLNNGGALMMSTSQIETYMEVAEQALDKRFDARGTDKSMDLTFTEKEDLKFEYVQAGKGKLKISGRDKETPILCVHPKTSSTFVKFLPLTFVSGDKGGKKAPITSAAWTFPTGRIPPSDVMVCGLTQWPTTGEMLVRLRVASESGKALLAVKMGYKSAGATYLTKLIGSAIVGDEQVLEYRVRMDSIPVVMPKGKDKFAAELVHICNDSVSASLHVKSLEIMTLPATSNAKHPLLSGTPEAILRAFVPKAWRRPVTEAEFQRLLKLHDQLAKTEPKTALRETLAVVLSSANFLYILDRREGAVGAELTEHELAARLSYLLWGTMPDDELRRVADAGRLREQLEAQYNRMLNDKRSDRFMHSFVHQWLNLDGLQQVAVNPEYFKDYTDDLKNDSANETYAFFDYILRNNLPATKLVASEFVVVNDRMATHYGIKNVTGSNFRPVPAPPHRGGLLTQASFLTANANGVDSHPIMRGTWILETILNDPPPPPPPNVPMLDDVKGQEQGLTIAQQLAEHRNNPACADCHQKIDPWGLSLENFNAIGLWRDDVTKTTTSAADKPSAKKKSAKKGEPEKPNSSSAKSEAPANGIQAEAAKTPVEELQHRLLTERGDNFARAFVTKLLTYSLGRDLDYADTKVVDELTAGFKANQYNIRLLLGRIIASNTFQQRN